MPSQKLHIFNIPELDKIINEIKDYFNYKVSYFDKKKDLIETVEKDKKILVNSVIIVKRKDFSQIKYITDENRINCITKVPIKIIDLMDQINTKLIQQNYLALSSVNINNYNLNINSRVLKKNNFELILTEREIDIIVFLKREKKPAKVDVLQKRVWRYGSDLETHTVETHIYRLRKKIKDVFNDDNFIQSKKNGYIINE
tara:strand:+ start:623 stop:1222 length:600 start_codon:yes stop_codon:yes gene_type:complete